MKRRTPPRGKRDSVYTLLVADGTVGGFFVQTKHKRIPKSIFPSDDSKVLILKNKKRPGERAMVAYLEWALSKRYLVAGDLLLMDNEASFKTELVQDFLSDHNIDFDYFPLYRGSLMNPCDNSFHKDLKYKYYAKIQNRTLLPIRDKLNFLREAYFAVNEKSIQNMFEHVGLTKGRPNIVARKLLEEGHHPSATNAARHRHQIHQFLDWADHVAFEFDNDSEHKVFTSKYPHHKY